MNMRDTHCNNRISAIAQTLFRALYLALYLVLFQAGSQVWAQATEEVTVAENEQAIKKQAAKNKAEDSSAQKDKVKAGGVKKLSGISIIGNSGYSIQFNIGAVRWFNATDR